MGMFDFKLDMFCRNCKYYNILRIIIWIMVPTLLLSHPQCLDFRPPFTISEERGAFCTDYTKFGCCTRPQHNAIRQRYDVIAAQLASVNINSNGDGLTSCEGYLKVILCQECSPYAAHLYDAETTQVKRALPGFCDKYCDDLYTTCRHIIPYVTDDVTVLQSLSHKQVFCSNNALIDKQYCYPDIMINTGLNNAITRQTTTTPGCLCLEPFASNLRNPLILRSPLDDHSGRIFVGLQLGLVYIYYGNGTRRTDLFMDLTSLVLTSSNSGDERGFLGLAFHPEFVNNGQFYVYVTLRGTDGSQRARLSEFKVMSNNPNIADVNSEREILELRQPFGNHNGGELLFGVDGYLYLFLGDGGAGGDPYNNGQNKNSLLGSVLRLDIDTGDPAVPYRIPQDNPFVNEVDARPEVYAFGIRNIWRCDVDEGDPDTGYGRGRIICGDVGQSAYEEIDIIINGGNYGWNAREGFECYRSEKCGRIGPEELPIYAYDHSVGNSVTGGHVYRGCLNPNMQGSYIYGDYGRGRIFSLTETPEGSNKWQNKEIFMCGDDLCFNGLTNIYERNILSFGEDYDGEVYMLTTSYPSPSAYQGSIYKLIDPIRRGDADSCRSSKWKQLQQSTTSLKPKTSTSAQTSRRTTSNSKPTTTKTRSTTPQKSTTRSATTSIRTSTRKHIITTSKLTTKTTKLPTSSKLPTTTDRKQEVTSTATTPTGQSLLPVCSDIAFVVDGSGSIRKHRFTTILEFIVDFTDTIDIGPLAYQLGVVTFGNKGTINIPLNAYNDQSNLHNAVRTKVPFKDENTNTSGGMATMRTQLFTQRYGGRQGYNKIGILVTDGRSTYDKFKTIPEAMNCHIDNITMYVLAFGQQQDLDILELESIASKPLDEHLIFLPDFDSVKTQFLDYWQKFMGSDQKMRKCRPPGTAASSSTTPHQPTTTSTPIKSTLPATTKTSTSTTTSVPTTTPTTTTSTTTEPTTIPTTTQTSTVTTSTPPSTTIQTVAGTRTTTVSTTIIKGNEWSCDFESSTSLDQWCGITQSSNDDFDWTITDKPTPSWPTGPNKAESGKYYVFIEASNPRMFLDTARLDLPRVSTGGRYCLRFFVHMFGHHTREVKIIQHSSNGVENEVWRRFGEEGNYWLEQHVQFESLTSEHQVSFIGARGREFSGDIALDNLQLTKQPCTPS